MRLLVRTTDRYLDRSTVVCSVCSLCVCVCVCVCVCAVLTQTVCVCAVRSVDELTVSY